MLDMEFLSFSYVSIIYLILMCDLIPQSNICGIKALQEN